MAFFGDNACEIWCRFNGTGSIAINDDYNVTSLNDNGTGDYTVNFSITMSSTNYALVYGTSGMILNTSNAMSTTTSQRVRSLHRDNSFQLLDVQMFSVVIFGDR